MWENLRGNSVVDEQTIDDKASTQYEFLKNLNVTSRSVTVIQGSLLSVLILSTFCSW